MFISKFSGGISEEVAILDEEDQANDVGPVGLEIPLVVFSEFELRQQLHLIHHHEVSAASGQFCGCSSRQRSVVSLAWLELHRWAGRPGMPSTMTLMKTLP